MKYVEDAVSDWLPVTFSKMLSRVHLKSSVLELWVKNQLQSIAMFLYQQRERAR